MRFFKKINLFTILLVVTALSFSYRLSNLGKIHPGSNRPVAAVLDANAAVSVDDIEKTPESAFRRTYQDKLLTKDNKEKAKLLKERGAVEREIHRQRGLPKFPVMKFTPAEIEVLQSLSKRRDKLDARDADLKQREALLEAAEKEVDQKINELQKVRLELEVLLGTQEKVQEARLKRLVKIYETMKPKDAARIFDTLELGVLMEVLARMSERKMAPIFASMNAQRAREVTLKLAEQRKLPSLPN